MIKRTPTKPVPTTVPLGGLLVIAWLLTVGCGPPRPSRPSFSPGRSAEQALELYDSDGDGEISADEASGSPGLLAAFSRVDADGSEKLSEQEIADRIAYYRRAGVAVISGSAEVYYRGQPLRNATVTFEPEPFLGEEFQPCSGVTDDFGQTYLSRENAEFPGIFLGFYRVRISQEKNGKEMVPARYNADTELGFEAADDLPDVRNVIRFDLK